MGAGLGSNSITGIELHGQTETTGLLVPMAVPLRVGSLSVRRRGWKQDGR